MTAMPTSEHAFRHTRRNFLAGVASAALGASAAAARPTQAAEAESPAGRQSPGSQRLSLPQLQKWESLQYGMFLCFGMSTFQQKEAPDGKAPRRCMPLTISTSINGSPLPATPA